MTILDELDWRGLLADCTDRDQLAQRLSAGQLTLYSGFDPTADTLHFGNLVPLLTLRRFQLFGHRPIAIAGGATGMIGDPGGRSLERPLLSPEVLTHNISCIKDQLGRFLDFDAPANAALLLDNAAWIAPITYLEFLRDVGKHFSVNAMVAKESVRSRMEDRESGISYTEFSYMLLQAFDFYHLHQQFRCELQIGGSDQWGNITAGIELCRRKAGAQVFGLTLPLITTAEGAKLGKSTGGGRIWLDPKKTSPYRFYQYFIQSDDRDVVRFLRYFTFLERAEIEQLATEHQANPGARVAHKRLAREITALVHGEAAAADAVRASDILFGGSLEGISEGLFRDVVDEAPTVSVAPDRLSGGVPLVDLLVESALSASKGQARKDIEGGGIYVNNIRAAGPAAQVASADLLFGKHLLLRKGKRTYAVVTVG